MFYRVAIRPDATALWQWRSTPLSSLEALFAFLRQYHSMPLDRLQVFSAATREELNAQLEQANGELEDRDVRPVTATLSTQGAASGSTDSAGDLRSIQGSQRSVIGNAMMHGSGINTIEKNRFELESGEGGDHDMPYLFTLPNTTSQMLAWIQLRKRAQSGELQA